MDDSDTTPVDKRNQTTRVIFAVSLLLIGLLGGNFSAGAVRGFFWGLGGLGLFVSGVYLIPSFLRPE